MINLKDKENMNNKIKEIISNLEKIREDSLNSGSKIKSQKKILDSNFALLQQANNEYLTLWVFSLSISLGLLAGIIGNFLHNITYIYLRNFYFFIMIPVTLVFLIFGIFILAMYIKSVKRKNLFANEFEKQLREFDKMYDKEIKKLFNMIKNFKKQLLN